MSNGKADAELSLQWHRHHDTLVSLLDSLWKRQELVDVTLVADGGKCIQVHRIVLCACSKYFQEVLTLKSTADKQAIVFLKDVTYSNLRAMVEYMYKGEVRINEDGLNSFLRTAKSLGIRGLMGDESESNSKCLDRNSGEPNRKPKRRKRDPSSSNEHSDVADGEPVAPSTPPSPRRERSHQRNAGLERQFKVEPSHSRLDEMVTEEPFREETVSITSRMVILDQELGDHELDLNDEDQCDSGPPIHTTDDYHPTDSDTVNEHLGREGTSPEVEDDCRSGDHPCPRCGRMYKSKGTVQRHLKYECGVAPSFSCPICQIPFRYKNSLQRHMNTHYKATK